MARICLTAATAFWFASFAFPASGLPLEVTVVNELGEPVGGVTVTTKPNVNLASETRTTDDQGKATFELDPKQASGLALWADDGDNLGQVQLAWNREPPEVLEPVTIKLGPARVMSVQIVNESGEPVSDAIVLLQANYREAARVTTDTSGAAKLRVPLDSPRQVVIAMKTGVGLDYFAFAREGAPQTDPNLLPQDHSEPIELVLNGARRVEVIVVDQDGEPLSGVRVYPWLYRKPNKGEDVNLSGLRDFKYETNNSGNCAFEVPVDMDRATTVWTHLKGYAAPERANFDPKSIDSMVRAKLEKMVQITGCTRLPSGVYSDGIKVTIAGDGHGMDGFRTTPIEVENDGTFEVLVNRNMYYQLVAGDGKQWVSPAVNVVVLDKDIDGVELSLCPATRVFGRVAVEGTGEPVPDQWLQLYQRTANSYYELPEEQQIPNPTDSRFAITPVVVQSQQTNDRGEFEFFVGPGSYYMHGTRTAEMPKFDIESETEKELLIEIKPVEMKKDRIVQGRVVLADNTDQAVAGAKVFSYPVESFGGRHIRATTNATGEFQAKQIMQRHKIHATATVGETDYAGIADITPDNSEYVVSVAPTAKLIGRLVERELDLPLDNRQIRCAIRLEYSDGTSTSAFGGSATTDEDGRFEIDGLIPSKKYTLTVTTELGTDGHGRMYRNAGDVTPDEAGIFVQEFRVSALDFPPTFAPVGQ